MSDPDVRQMEDYMSRPEETDADIIEQLQEENKALKESRDELLEAVSQCEIVFRMNKDFYKAEMLIAVIVKAEALKEKEA